MRFSFHKALIAGCCLLAGTSAASAEDIIKAGDMPPQWQYTEYFDQKSPTADRWWKEFNDPVLDSLIMLGVDNNYDVLMAAHRIEMARQQLRQTRSQYYPQLSLSGSWSKAQTSGMNGPEAGMASEGSYFSLDMDMSWQIDIFGKIRAQAKGSEAAVKASRAQYDGVMVAMAAKIASAYMQLRTLQAEMDVLVNHIAQQKRVKEITEARYEAGLASKLDVAQARTTYYSTEASITSMRTSITSTINALAVLLGMYPEQITPLLAKSAPMPDYHRLVSVGIPLDLLRRRPDIVQAEQTLAQYAAAVGVAKKDFLPTVALKGSVGTEAHSASNIFGKQSFTYTIAPAISWSLFKGFSRNAALASAKEQMQYGIDNYNNTVLTAVQEVDNAMATYFNDMEYISTIEEVVDQAKESFDLSIDLYKQGLTAFINVSNAQITLLQYSNELVSAKGQALAALINLYEALGGGF